MTRFGGRELDVIALLQVRCHTVRAVRTSCVFICVFVLQLLIFLFLLGFVSLFSSFSWFPLYWTLLSPPIVKYQFWYRRSLRTENCSTHFPRWRWLFDLSRENRASKSQIKVKRQSCFSALWYLKAWLWPSFSRLLFHLYFYTSHLFKNHSLVVGRFVFLYD